MGLIAAAMVLLLTPSTAHAQLSAEISAGYAAKMLCSTVFVSHRDAAEALRQDLALAAPVPYRVDQATRSVVAWLPGAAARRAVFRDGLGCTLRADSTLPTRGSHGAAHARATGHRGALWPAGERVDTTHFPNGGRASRLRLALDSAFAEPGPTNPRRTRGIVIAWNGRIIAERYAPGYDAATPQLGWSMTKSVTNALVGILVKQGKLATDQPAAAPEWNGAGDARAAIRLDDLMRMSSGLTFDETYSGVASDVAKDLFLAGDAGAYAASLPLERPIGTRWAYSSGTTNIISRAIRIAIRNDSAYLQFPRRALFAPLGMRTAILEPDPSGTFVGSSYMYASARDWARFGQLYLNDGMWNGARILPKGWIKYSTTRSPADPSGGYGAQVWINAGDSTGKRPHPNLPPDAFFFLGHDQQNVVIIPSRRLVAVRLGYTPGRDWDLDSFIARVLDALPPASGPAR